MSRWLVEKSTSLLESKTSRRGFLVRAAVVGSALTVAPLRYLLRPGTAYSAVCRCANTSCNCGSACCDGYTEFCCVLTGSNTCPPDSFPAGWWKADGTAFCSANRTAPRYYIDCNLRPGAGCACRCGGTCNNRKTCCNVFRYGQCHQEIRGTTAIKCRIVTCTPPWVFDGTCTRTSATDQSTASHNAACLQQQAAPAFPAGALVQGQWFLRNTHSTGPGEGLYSYGNPGDFPLMGDWNGDGVDTPAVFRGGIWYLRNTNTPGIADIVFAYGNPGDVPVVGDWNGDGIETPGVVRGGQWHLRNTNSTGIADVAFLYGNAGDIPQPSDWNADRVDTPGVFRGGYWFLRNTNTPGIGDIVLAFGSPGDSPVAGDWNADGADTPGVVRGGTWFLRNTNSTGIGDIAFMYGNPTDIPLPGDWNADGVDSQGVGR